MTTMAEKGVTSSTHDVLTAPMTQDDTFLTLPHELSELDVASLKQTTTPLFSQHLLTVEQLAEISVDPDIQASVTEFLKGLTTQMFARIVRNGSPEVGRWLGAKVQGERDGWTAMLRMAMEEIEFHRKSALQGQVVLSDTLEQLRTLVDCFQVEEEVRKEISNAEDAGQGIQTCVQVLAECCNALMEDRFQCIDVLDCGDPLPESLGAAVQALKERLARVEAERNSLQTQCSKCTAENAELRKRNELLFQEVEKTENKMKDKQGDLEALKTQLKEIDEAVRFRKSNMVDKCVGTALDLFKPQARPPEPAARTSGASPKKAEGASAAMSKAREDMYTQTFREPSFIELSEEKLRVLKERARKLENSLHGAIASMDKLRKAAPKTSSSSFPCSAPTAATFVTLPSHPPPKEAVKSWMSASFEVTNATSASVTAPVPKLGHFKPTERRCLSERPPCKVNDEPSDKGRWESRKTARSRVGQVSKCLRCQKLFTTTDNHKLACCFHSKGKERMEVYSEGGQLVKVKYVWKCCHQYGESDGCCYGHHV